MQVSQDSTAPSLMFLHLTQNRFPNVFKEEEKNETGKTGRKGGKKNKQIARKNQDNEGKERTQEIKQILEGRMKGENQAKHNPMLTNSSSRGSGSAPMSPANEHIDSNDKLKSLLRFLMFFPCKSVFGISFLTPPPFGEGIHESADHPTISVYILTS